MFLKIMKGGDRKAAMADARFVAIQMRFNLEKGFPAVSTKQLYFKKGRAAVVLKAAAMTT